MSRIRGAVVLTVVAAFALAGCSSTPSTGSPSAGTSAEAVELTYEAATGDRIAGTGYSYAVPEGWADAGDSAATAGADSLAADMTDSDGFADNVNVILSPASNVTPELVETSGVDELESAGATDVTVLDRVTVGGEESAHLSAGLASGGTSYQIEQYYVTNNGQTYVVTFSFSPTVPAGDREELAGSVLASWSWE